LGPRLHVRPKAGKSGHSQFLRQTTFLFMAKVLNLSGNVSIDGALRLLRKDFSLVLGVIILICYVASSVFREMHDELSKKYMSGYL
jgi:hypothetical protein